MHDNWRLPPSWGVLSFEECIVQPSRGKRLVSVQTAEYQKQGTYPIIDQGANFIAGYTDNVESVYSGTLPVIIFGDHTRIFKYVDFAFAPGADGTKILIPSKNLIAKFFYFALSMQDIPSRGYNRHFKLLKDKQIPHPPLPEQRSIASVLSKIQEAIAAQQEIIDRTRELKKALMAKFFAEIISNSAKARIDSFADVKGGKRLPKGESFADGKTPFPYIRVVDMKDNTVQTNDLKYLTPEIQQTISRYIINRKDLYISIAGTIGLVGQIPESLDGANLTENAAKIVLREGVSVTRDYLMWFLDSEIGQAEIATRTTKTSQPKLALARIGSIEVPVPPEKLQKEVSSALRTIIHKRRAAEAKKDLLQDLFKSMLHELMTGSIRTFPLMEA